MTDAGEQPAPIDAPAPWRNREAILAVLQRVLPKTGRILEVASGTGQHAAYFAPRLAPLVWQPSDVDPAMFASIAAWAALAATEFEGAWTPRPPIIVDATSAQWPIDHADAVVCINMVHIAPPAATTGVLAGAGRILPPGGVLYFYGPFMRDGRHTAPSNQVFDAHLRERDARWGIRDLDRVVAEAAEHGLELAETVDMPANNLSVVLRRSK